jgi:hypothetical protein
VRLVLRATGFDLPRDPATNHLGPLRTYVQSRYCVLKNFPEYEAWVRIDSHPRTPGCQVVSMAEQKSQ